MKQITTATTHFIMKGFMDRQEWLEFMQIPGAEYNKKLQYSNICYLYSITRILLHAKKYDWELDFSTDEIKHNQKFVIDRSKDDGAFFTYKKNDLYPFQFAGSWEAVSRLDYFNNVLIADEMGLGKTIQAIEVINITTPVFVLVVCPASLKLNWKSELEIWLRHKRPITVLKNPDKMIPLHINIINYASLKKFATVLKDIKFDLVIFDESHYLKSPKAIRTKLCFGAKKVINSKSRIFLTGTPILNRPVELFPLLKDCGIQTNWKSFTHNFCDAKEKVIYTPAGRQTIMDVSGSSNENELQDILRSTIMIRRLKKDVLPQLPEKIQQIVFLPENGSIANIKKERLSFAETLKQPNLALAISNLSEIRQENALRKIKFTKEYIDNLLEQKEKVVIFAWHTCVIDELMISLKSYSPLSITGNTPMNFRKLYVDYFQDKGNRVIIGNIKAMGQGLTLHAASDVVFLEMDWTPGNNTQAEDRIHRIGQTELCHIHYLVYADTVDAYIAKKVVEKKKVIDKILDKYTSENGDCTQENKE